MNTSVAGGVQEVLDRTGIVGLVPAITGYLAAQRWSGARGSGASDVRFVDVAPIIDDGFTVVFAVVCTRVGSGEREARFALPLGLRPHDDPLVERAPAFMIGETLIGERRLVVYDAVGDPAYIHWLWNAMRENTTVPSAAAELRFAGRDPNPFGTTDPDVRWLGTEQSNTSMVLGDTVFLKHLRRIDEGPSHELEMAEALAAAGFEHLAPLIGTALYAPAGAAPCLLVLAQPYLHNATEGWALALTSLRDLYAAAEERKPGNAAERHEAVDEQGGAFTAEAARLGAVVAQMHKALASPALPAQLAPEPLTRERLQAWAATMVAELDALLQRSEDVLAPLRAAREGIAAHFRAVRDLDPSGLCTRIHGDLHLGQVMRNDSGWYILDFEGEPNRTPAQRRERSSPLRDVAAMLRSFDYAAAAALAERADPPGPERDQLGALGDSWAQINRDSFWAAYLGEMEGTGVLAPAGASLTLRRAFEVQKAVYEVGYELGHRPSWAHIPIGFLMRGAA